MKACLGKLHDKPVMIEVRDGVVYIDDEPEPIKNITEADIAAFQEDLDNVPESDNEGYEALLNAIRAGFLAKLLGNAVGDDTITRLTHILDSVHYDVLQYLGDDQSE